MPCCHVNDVIILETGPIIDAAADMITDAVHYGYGLRAPCGQRRDNHTDRRGRDDDRRRRGGCCRCHGGPGGDDRRTGRHRSALVGNDAGGLAGAEPE